MHRLDHALENEIAELDTVLLRLTTLRLLMAAGRHRMIDRAVAELEDAFGEFEAAERRTRDSLDESGLETIDEAADRSGDELLRARLQDQRAQLRTLHRDVRVALSSTGAAASRSLKLATDQLGIAPPVASTRRAGANRFYTGEY